MGTKNEGFYQRSKGGNFGKSKFLGLGGVLETSFSSTTLQEVWILHTKGCFVVFSALRGCLGWILGLLGILPCFDPTHCRKFGTGFWLGNGWNLDSCSS